MAKIRPEEPKKKASFKARIPGAGEFFGKNGRDSKKLKGSKKTTVPSENERFIKNDKISGVISKVQSMDVKQGRKLVACVTGGFLLATYLLLVHVYSDRFISGTYINGIDVGGKTPEQVEALLQKRIESYTLSLTMRSTKAAADYVKEVQSIGKEEPIEPEPVDTTAENSDGGAMEIIAPIEYASSANTSTVLTANVSGESDGFASEDDAGADTVSEENSQEANTASVDSAAAQTGETASGANAVTDESVTDESLSDTLTSDEAALDAAGKEQEINIEDATPEEKSRKSQDVAYKDVVIEKIPGTAFDYTYVPSGEVAEIQKAQNPFTWIIGGIGNKLGYKKEYTVASATEYDEEKLSKKLSALVESDAEKQTAPTNAQIILKNDHTFEIIPETYGTALDTDGLIEIANQAVKSSTKELNIAEDEELYEQPSVVATNTDLVNQEEALNTFLDTEITYQMPDNQTRILNRDTTSQWVSLQDNGYYYVDEAVVAGQARQYAAGLAAELDIVRDTRDFESTNAGVVQVECERYGRVVNEEEEAAKITQELLSCTSETREPVYSMNNLEKDPTFGGTYVEVDKCDQTVFYYENHEMLLATECVTGTETNASRSTPTGVYSIFDKEQNRTLRGSQLADGSYQYSSFVNYWMPFNGGIGLHDATWRDDFGGGIYWYSGSHGCVNLPYWAAQELYSMVDVGTTVIVIDY